MRVAVPIIVRPLLVSALLATDDQGPVILINSEQPDEEKVIGLWHEVLHLIGMKDETEVELRARCLSTAFPDVLRYLP